MEAEIRLLMHIAAKQGVDTDKIAEIGPGSITPQENQCLILLQVNFMDN